MDNDPWQYLMSSSSRQLPQSRSDVIIRNDYEEEAYWDEEGEEMHAEFPCPYCNDDFDLVELCCHIQDAHFAHPKNGVCPVCAVVVTTNMIAHLTKQHGKMIKIQHKLKLSKGEPDANLSLLLKEFHEEYLKSLLDGSSMVSHPSYMEPDPLLFSFFHNFPPVVQSESVQISVSTEPTLSVNRSGVTMLERMTRLLPLSDIEHEEKAQRSEFVLGLAWSTFFDDCL